MKPLSFCPVWPACLQDKMLVTDLFFSSDIVFSQVFRWSLSHVTPLCMSFCISGGGLSLLPWAVYFCVGAFQNICGLSRSY